MGQNPRGTFQKWRNLGRVKREEQKKVGVDLAGKPKADPKEGSGFHKKKAPGLRLGKGNRDRQTIKSPKKGIRYQGRKGEPKKKGAA